MRELAQMLVEQMLDGQPIISTPVLPPDLPTAVRAEPLDPKWATQDIALEYIEGEVGRHDWEHNWQDHKTKNQNLRERIAAWLQHYEIDHDPQAIIDYIDNELLMHPGKWL